MALTKTLLIPDYQKDDFYSGETFNSNETENIDDVVVGKGITLKQDAKETIIRRTKAWGLEYTSGWRLLLEFGLTRNTNKGFEQIPDYASITIPVTDYLKERYEEYKAIVSDIIIAWRDCIIEMNSTKTEKAVDNILLHGDLYGNQTLAESRGIVGKHSGFTEISELPFSDTEYMERFFNATFISLNRRKKELEFEEEDISYYMESYDENVSEHIKIIFTSNTKSNGKKNKGLLNLVREKLATINSPCNLTDRQIVYLLLTEELELLIGQIKTIQKKSRKKIDEEEYKQYGQIIPEEPKNRNAFNYEKKLKEYKEYRYLVTVESYKNLLDELSNRYGKEFSFYQYYADVYLTVPNSIYERVITGTEKYNLHNGTNLTEKQYIQLLYKDGVARQDGLKIARNRKILIDPEKDQIIKYSFYDIKTSEKKSFSLIVNELVYKEIENLQKAMNAQNPIEVLDYALMNSYAFLSGNNKDTGLNPILNNLSSKGATEHMKMVARTLVLTYLYDRLITCLPCKNYKMEDYYHDIIISTIWYLSQEIENKAK